MKRMTNCMSHTEVQLDLKVSNLGVVIQVPTLNDDVQNVRAHSNLMFVWINLGAFSYLLIDYDNH